MTDISKGITSLVRRALNGDKSAYKPLNHLLQLPFSSINKLFHTTPEAKEALNILAGMKATQKRPDSAAVKYCRKHVPELVPKTVHRKMVV